MIELTALILTFNERENISQASFIMMIASR